jgi:hypothetical protein
VSRAVTALLFLWAGLLMGVSFVATPAKFLAPSLPMAQALDVGRWTFNVLSQIEWGLLDVVASLLVFAGKMERRGLLTAVLVVIAATLAVESLGLRPALDARVAQIMAGGAVAPSRLHVLYIALDAARLALLVAAGSIALLGIPPTNKSC